MTDFLTADTNLPSYMMFPRFLLDMKINETAKMLYIILLDRARLSQKNEGWSDINGHVFIYFTIEALAEVLHKSQMTVKTALAVLEKQELIFRKRQGPGQPNRIYVKLPKETIHYTDRFLSLSPPISTVIPMILLVTVDTSFRKNGHKKSPDFSRHEKSTNHF